MTEPLTVLRTAGFPVDQLSSSQRAVLASLSEHETAVLVSVQEKLREAEGEVVAHDLKLL
ncbi:aroma-sacti cluster domain-containing protein [Micromonosporaceae bacterium Da 78-11]